MSAPSVIVAAAGSGKTTRLVREYLRLLRDGIDADRIVAITFTRMAGAELVDRVGRALLASLGDADAASSLHDVFDSEFRPVLPDAETSQRALRALGAAPVGTTDSFVQSLLAEFALDAALPLSKGTVPLDQAGAAPTTRSDAFEVAARQVIDPEDGNVPLAAQRCLACWTLDTLVEQVAALAAAPPAAAFDVGALLDEMRERVRSALRPRTSQLTSLGTVRPPELLQAAQTWVQGGCWEPASDAVLQYLGLRLTREAKDVDVLHEALAGRTLDLGVVGLPLADALLAFGKCGGGGGLAQAESLRTDLRTLATETRDFALRLAAASGALDHSLALDAAIQVCAHPPDRLRRRFGALLVDEAQDANPAQMQLYDALSRLPGNGTRLPTVYVGDPRQSIYLFRGAEPRVFEACATAAATAGKLSALPENRRSTPDLVGAHRAIFEALDRLPGVASIAEVGADQTKSSLTLSSDLKQPRPVLYVTPPVGERWSAGTASDAAVEAFAERLADVWAKEPKHSTDSAAVLASSWRGAVAARDRLRVILGPRSAFLEGSRELLATRTAADVRVLVRALWDRTDAIAWAGVYKAPYVGLSDAALVTVNGGGMVASLSGEGLDPQVHDAADVAAFAEAAPVLREARASLGRTATAEVIETVATRLHWRSVLRAGPDGDDAVAQLEVLLDWMRMAEREGADPNAILELLDPENETSDAPRPVLARPARSIACTTVHQAKGLAWDHVCLVGVGSPGRPDYAWQRAEVESDGSPATLLGVQFDPEGGLANPNDFVSLLARAVREARADEERLRCFYVGMTRARRGVVFGVGGGSRLGKQMQAALSGRDLDGVATVQVDAIPARAAAPRAHAGAVRGFGAQTASAVRYRLVRPSADANTRNDDDVRRRVEVIARRATFLAGNPAPSRTSPPALGPQSLGTFLHGWMEHGGLKAADDLAALAAAYMQTWPKLPPEDADYLLALSESLRIRLPAVYARLTHPDANRIFEAPMIGVSEEDPDDRRLYVGNIDLLLMEPDGRVLIVDFKGQLAPESLDDLHRDGQFRKNVLQVDAYRTALSRAGYRVSGCALLFLGKMVWVEWPPEP